MTCISLSSAFSHGFCIHFFFCSCHRAHIFSTNLKLLLLLLKTCRPIFSLQIATNEKLNIEKTYSSAYMMAATEGKKLNTNKSEEKQFSSFILDSIASTSTWSFAAHSAHGFHFARCFVRFIKSIEIASNFCEMTFFTEKMGQSLWFKYIMRKKSLQKIYLSNENYKNHLINDWNRVFHLHLILINFHFNSTTLKLFKDVRKIARIDNTTTYSMWYLLQSSGKCIFMENR